MKLAVLQTALGLSLFAGCATHKETPPVAPTTLETPNPYTKPLTSIGGKFGALPPAVQNTIRAEAGAAEIIDVVTESTPDRVYYKVLFREKVIYPPLYIAPDGSILNPDLSVAVPAPRDSTGGAAAGPVETVTLNDLPANVVKVIRDQASDAQVTTISKEIWGTHIVYLVSFKDPTRHPKLLVVADGTILHVAP
jgi:hypothetical protein